MLLYMMLYLWEKRLTMTWLRLDLFNPTMVSSLVTRLHLKFSSICQLFRSQMKLVTVLGLGCSALVECILGPTGL